MPHEPRYHKGDKIGGRFLVFRALAGGMGEVYLCLDLEQMEPFALKTFQARYLASATARKYFEREAATWVKLEKHPNVVRCNGVIEAENVPFLSLEWVAGTDGSGTDLRDWLVRRGPLEPRRALEFVVHVSRALVHAERKVPGFVHCDIKPENVLVAQGRLAKLTDFGLAKVVCSTDLAPASDAAQTAGSRWQVSSAGGTPPYMAPEQWRGEPVDLRTDIYAVGCLLYELLTGRPPFLSSTGEGMKRRHLEMSPPSLGEISEGLPCGDVQTLLERCLAKDKANRYASASELLEVLSRAYELWCGARPRAEPRLDAFTAADYCNRSCTYHALGRYAEALADCDAALRLGADAAEIHCNRGLSLAGLGRYDEALGAYDTALRLNPNDPKVYSNRAITHKRQGRDALALADYDAALHLDADLADVYYNRGVLYAHQGRHQEALAEYNSIALRLDPELQAARRNRGNTYKELGRHREAMADYDAAIRIDRDDAKAYYSRGLGYEDLGLHAEALNDFNAAIRLDPDLAEAHDSRASIYADMGRYDDALAGYAAAIRSNPDLAAAYFNRGNAYLALRRYQDALADYDAAIRLEPQNSADAYSNRGVARGALGQRELELADYDAALRIDHSDPEVHFNRANTLKALGRHAEALAAYDDALRLDPLYAEAYCNKGSLHTEREEWHDALHAFEAAAQLGEPVGARHAERVRQMIGLPPVRTAPDPGLEALQAVLTANSTEELHRVLDQHPILARKVILERIEEAVASALPQKLRVVQQRLAELRTIVSERKAR